MGTTNKLLLPYGGHTVIEETLAQISNSMVDDTLIVTGHESARIEALLADQLTDRVALICNRRYRLGRAESIKCAVRRIADKTDAALFMVADKPGVTSGLINRAIDQFRKTQTPILYVDTPTGRGHPIIFSSALFDDLLLLKGDKVGDELVSKCEDDVFKLWDEARQIDIDNDADYRMALQDGAGR